MADIRFSPGHIWARVEDNEALIGLSDYFQDQMGDITALQLPDVGDVLQASRWMGAVESEEASSPIEAPLTGEVIDVNSEVLTSPDLVNSEPYDAGWLLKVRLDDPSELDQLLTEDEYTDLTG